MQHSSGELVKDEVKSIDKLLLELGECSELLDSTLQQARPSKNVHVNGGARSISPPGVPVRNTSFDAGIRYQMKGAPRVVQNGVGAVRQGQYPTGSKPSRIPTAPPPYSQNYSWNSNSTAGQMPNGYPAEPQRQAPPSFVLHEAPLSQTSPPLSPLSPKFYATQITPMTFKATTVTHTTVGYNKLPSDEGSSSGGVVTNGVLSVADEWTSHPGKQRSGPHVLDFNNNKSENGVDLFDFEDRKGIEDSGTLPERGNVRSKVALLTDMLHTDNVRPGHHQHLKCQIIPMPGLTSVSASDVFKEISNYNAQSLAPGELSHSSGTLYSSKAPPKRIIEPSKYLEPAEPPPPEIDIVAVKGSLKHVVPALEYRVHDQKTDYNDQHPMEKSPSSSIDGISLDEGVESKGSTDETTNFGVSPSASDGHTDSAFGESIISSSPVFTPVGGHPSNQFNPTLSMTESRGVEAAHEPLSQRSPSAAVHVKEAREDEEAGYARLEDIRLASQARTQASPESAMTSETHTTLERTSPLDTRGVGEREEQIEAKNSSDDVVAIQDILTEMTDMSLIVPEPAQLSRSSTPHSFSSGGLESRSPVRSSGSGVFENAVQRKKSQPHSDKGYGSTTSVSSGSSVDNVFLPESPKIPGLKFDRDTSSFWYKPNITRSDAISILRDSEPGSFIIRDSQSFPGAFGLAVKVAVPPAHVLQGLQGDMTKVDLDNELVRHFLIETTKKGVRLKGINDEPVFGSLASFVYQHSITPLALPIRLNMPAQDLSGDDKAQSTDAEDGQSWPKGAVGSLMYLGHCDVEMLTGASAIQRTVERLSTDEAAKKFTTVGFKVTPQGMTVTDNERKVFFRQHFHMKSILYCGIDPGDKRWDLKTPTYSGKSKSFGLVLRKTGGVHNECHLFGEISKDWPSSILVNILNRSMTSST